MNTRGVVASIVAIALAAGCSSILDSSSAYPDEAMVNLNGSTTVPLRVVMSNNFIGVWNPDAAKWDVTFNSADTVMVTSFPFNRTVPLRNTGVFFVRVTNPDVDESATVDLRVQIDNRDAYRQEATLRDASLEYIFFVN